MTAIILQVQPLTLTDEKGTQHQLAILEFPQYRMPSSREFRKGLSALGLEEAGITECELYRSAFPDHGERDDAPVAFTKVEKPKSIKAPLFWSWLLTLGHREGTCCQYGMFSSAARPWRFVVRVPKVFEYVRLVEWPIDSSGIFESYHMGPKLVSDPKVWCTDSWNGQQVRVW